MKKFGVKGLETEKNLDERFQTSFVCLQIRNGN